MIDLEMLELKKGAHENCEEGMCVMEAVSCWSGGPFTDAPATSSPVLGIFLRKYNDSVDSEVRQSLKPFIPRLVNSRGTYEIEEQRSVMALDWLIRVNVAAWLRAAGLVMHADRLASLAPIRTVEDVESIKPVLDVARAAASAAAWDAPWDAAWVAASAADWDAARAAAWAAAWDAASAAARAAAWDAASAAAWDAASAAASAALQPTVLTIQATVPELLDRMLRLTEGEPAQ